jgi:tRNA (cytidine32/uridine32-2'-O)-methyltransferase
VTIRFVLHRPRSSQNIGAAARALANTAAGALWVVEPLGFDRAQAAKLAAGADAVLEAMRVVRTLDEALEQCVEVVMTTGRETRPPPACSGRPGRPRWSSATRCAG